MCVNVFLCNQEQTFSLIRQTAKNFPIDMSIDMTLQKWEIFIIGFYGKISHFLSDQAEISFLVVYKTLTHIIKVSDRKKAFDKLIWNEQ